MFTWLVLMVVHIGQLVVSVETVFGLTDWPLYKCGQWWVFRQCLDWLADLCTYVASGECSDSVWIDWPLYKCGQRVCSDRMRVWSHSLKSSTLAYSQCSDDFTNKNLCVLTLIFPMNLCVLTLIFPINLQPGQWWLHQQKPVCADTLILPINLQPGQWWLCQQNPVCADTLIFHINPCVLTHSSSPLTYSQASDDFTNKNLYVLTLSSSMLTCVCWHSHLPC